MYKISIIVCTYNRAGILRECLNSLANQSADTSEYEVLVVDNNSIDNTKEVIREFEERYQNFRYAFEQEQGLGSARNRGAKEAHAEWLFYIDDDAKVPFKTIEKAIYDIEKFDFGCLGGRYIAWYKDKKPPQWLPEGFGTKELLRDSVGEINEGYLSGGVFLIKKSVLQDIGYFPNHIGMKGNKTAYGEETHLQNKLMEKGYKRGFDPEIIIEHLVAEYKYSVLWHLKRNYAAARDGVFIWPATRPKKIKTVLKEFFVNLKKFSWIFRKKDYYYQNFIIDLLGPVCKELGVTVGVMNYKKSDLYEKNV